MASRIDLGGDAAGAAYALLAHARALLRREARHEHFNETASRAWHADHEVHRRRDWSSYSIMLRWIAAKSGCDPGVAP